MEVTFRLSNSTHSPLHAVIEPWAREYDLPAGGFREFVFSGPDPADLEVRVESTAITIYGWVGSVLDGMGLPVPEIPRGPGDIRAR
jgi:hypothetical protein